ncbi:hypothetical protein DA103_09145 [Enterobacter cloacae]|uniref:Ead/Ea22-like family protein n=1 Tax=Enterobacter cloacae TaxID=550 RepID=A0A2T4Y182_ENTCL|nr:hypothetical protein [Enterobacter cloacae]PTM35934.1 hypothetical protein DA103_09145 [Enterobacter cloacae]
MKNNTQPALKERIEKALEDFTKGRASMHVPPLDTDVDMVLAECSDRLSELEARCAALAAELQSVKAMNDCLSEELRGYESDGAFEGPKMHLLWWQCETPNHDAFLAEVRAQGVEMLVKHCEQKALEKSYDFFMDAGAVAAQFAAQLRKGVQS